MHKPTQEHIQCPCYLWLCDIVLFVPCFCIPCSSSWFIPCFPVGVLNWTIVNKLPGTENCLACAAFGSWLLSDVLELCFFNYYYYFQFGWLFDSRKSFISFYIHIVVWMKRTFCFQYESTPWPTPLQIFYLYKPSRPLGFSPRPTWDACPTIWEAPL